MHSSGKSGRLIQGLSESVAAAGGIFLEVFMEVVDPAVTVYRDHIDPAIPDQDFEISGSFQNSSTTLSL
jgi:hypothetical protein